jgi:hypothetical protein
MPRHRLSCRLGGPLGLGTEAGRPLGLAWGFYGEITTLYSEVGSDGRQVSRLSVREAPDVQTSYGRQVDCDRFRSLSYLCRWKL